MGIKLLNKYFKNECPRAIKQKTFWELREKKIVIDTSIYMYRLYLYLYLMENHQLKKRHY